MKNTGTQIKPPNDQSDNDLCDQFSAPKSEECKNNEMKMFL